MAIYAREYEGACLEDETAQPCALGMDKQGLRNRVWLPPDKKARGETITKVGGF